MKYVYTCCLLFLLLSASVFGQIQSRGGFVEKFENNNNSFAVLVEVDSPNRTYAEGELLRATVTSREDGYLYLFYRDADAKVTVLFPNQYQRDNFIRQNERVPVPGQGAGFQIRIGAPFGNELLKAVVSKKPLSFIDSAMDFAKFRIAPIDDNAGNNIAQSMEQVADADWAEHSINIRTVQSSGGGGNNNRPSPPFSPGSGTAKVHLILAADFSTTDNVGSVVQSDAYNLRELIENNVARDRLNIIDMKDQRRGDQLTKEDMLRAIRDLTVNSDDAVFFFYSGHGAYDAVADQYFALASKEPVFRSEILTTMESKHVRLAILISDCCYEQSDVPTHLRPPQPRGGRAEVKGYRQLFEKLFFEAQGVVDITASEKGTYGFIYPKESREENGVSKGSVFTWNLCKVLNTETFASKNWEDTYKLVRDETNKDYQKVFSEHIREGRITQKELIPHAFTLP